MVTHSKATLEALIRVLNRILSDIDDAKTEAIESGEDPDSEFEYDETHLAIYDECYTIVKCKRDDYEEELKELE